MLKRAHRIVSQRIAAWEWRLKVCGRIEGIKVAPGF